MMHIVHHKKSMVMTMFMMRIATMRVKMVKKVIRVKKNLRKL
jgi:hypothetical protein